VSIRLCVINECCRLMFEASSKSTSRFNECKDSVLGLYNKLKAEDEGMQDIKCRRGVTRSHKSAAFVNRLGKNGLDGLDDSLFTEDTNQEDSIPDDVSAEGEDESFYCDDTE
ncbi:hypothetical protein PIB30_103349, partial [Stylosanthes scabra]|nr:hypothetical protein [Stylosanthes scabra]